MRLLVLALLVPVTLSIMAQQKLSGIVKDELTKEVLIGAHIFKRNTMLGTVSDVNGFFSLEVSERDTLIFSMVGYSSKQLIIKWKNDSVVVIDLTGGTTLQTINVKGDIRNEDFNIVKLTPKEFNTIPSLGGKPDVFKSLQLLPGVSTQNEGSGSLIVRGGDPGQNMYLIDNAPVAYVHHLGGFMSVFNPDMINELSVLKSGFPPKYGGKISSIIDITQREGSMDHQKGNISIGITDLSFAVEGPLNKQKNASYIVCGRKTLIDPLMALGSMLSGGGDYIAAYGFHDINAKFTWHPSHQDKISLNIYQGDDYLNYWSNTKLNGRSHLRNIWGNWLLAGNWKRIFSSGMYLTNTLSYNRYRLKDSKEFDNSSLHNYNETYESAVSNINFQSDWFCPIRNNFVINIGAQTRYWLHNPNSFFKSDLISQNEAVLTTSTEMAVYANLNANLGRLITVDLGARGFRYGSLNFSEWSLLPRVDLKLKINTENLIGINYMEAAQNSHLLFVPGNIMQNEIWIPSGSKIPMAGVKQFSLGWKSAYKQEMYNAEVNLYHKRLSNLSQFKEGYNFTPGDPDWMEKLENGGIGVSNGLEVLLKKVKGRNKGFLSYTYSKTNRKYANINKGFAFPYKYDRPHSLSVSMSRDISQRVSISMLWIYQTGLPYTPVIGRQYTPGYNIDGRTDYFYYETLAYGDRNSARMRDYHRLDLGLQYKKFTRKGNRAVWSFSVYNAYARQNPHNYYYNNNNSGELYHPEDGQGFKPIYLYQVSYFPLIPSISYKVFFEPSKERIITKRKSQFFKKLLYFD